MEIDVRSTAIRNAIGVFLAITLMASAGLTATTMADPVNSPSDRFFAKALLTQSPVVAAKDVLRFSDTKAVAAVLSEKMADGNILIDAWMHYAIVPYVDDPKKLVITSDLDFTDMLKNPVGNVAYILVPEPIDLASKTEISSYYPDLYRFGTPWATFETDFPDYPGRPRLYRVHGE